MPLRSGGISSKIGDAAATGSREATAKVPKPIKNWRRLVALRLASSIFAELCEMAAFLSCAPGAGGLPHLRKLRKRQYRPKKPCA